MKLESTVTLTEAFKRAKLNGHTMKKGKLHDNLQLYQCSKKGCSGMLFQDLEHDLVFGSALSHECKDYKLLVCSSVSSKSPHSELKNIEPEFPAMKIDDKDWDYDNGVTKKLCPDCNEPLYRVFKLENGQKYVGFFCEKCKSIYNIGLNSYCYKRLTAQGQCYHLGEPV